MFDSLTLNILVEKFLVGILFFIRIMGMLASGPFFKNTAIIPQVKIFLGALLAVVMTSAFWEEQPQIDFHLFNMVLLVIKEILVGLAIGFSANMVFHAARFAGGLVDFDMGYQTALLFDSSSTTPTLVGEFKSLMTLMLFIFLNGHHFLIEGIFASARIVPLTFFSISETTVALLTKIAVSVMIIGVKMAAPVLVALFLTNLLLALLARIAPQTNIFILSFQLKVVVGLLVLFASMPIFVFLAKYSLSTLETETMKILLSLNPTMV